MNTNPFLGTVAALVCANLIVACGSEDPASPGLESPDAGDSGNASDAPERMWSCVANGGEAPDYLEQIGCESDFRLLASRPLNASVPGARSLKTVVDRDANYELTFQNSVKYPIHWEFVSEHRSVAAGLPRVPTLSEFNGTEYASPNRRFILGALTHYEGPDVWAYEIAPYDSAGAEMIAEAFDRIVDNTYIGSRLRFHPTSLGVETSALDLPERIKIVTTNELFEGIDYQALNPAESYGRLRFITADELETEYVDFRDIVVLDRVPNDISVTLGIITSEFQTPLAHINVLSQNRGTPNMALRNAYDNEDLRELEGKWVRLTVQFEDYDVVPVDQADADAWWEEHKPAVVQVPGMDLTKTELTDIEDTVDLGSDDLRAAIKAGTRAFGGKAANYAALADIEGVPVPKAFAIPVHFYMQFMRENGFDERVANLLADEEFQNDPKVRDEQLGQLRADMMVAPVNADFQASLLAKLEAEFPNTRMRFRSSTNAEDLDGFTGAGLYTSRSGDPNDPQFPVFDAIREVWSSVWYFRAFEERRYRSIDHLAVGMALLVHHSFPDEEANGVALTNNPFERTGIDPAFYVNVQYGESSVVLPPAGVTTDEFLFYYDQANKPVTYLSQSNLIPDGEHVLTTAQIQELGNALDKIRKHFTKAYSQNPWWAMDVEFKFDGDPGETPKLSVKQARPFGNR